MIARALLATTAILALAGCVTRTAPPIVPQAAATQSVEARAAAIVARMSLEHKISQLVMPDIASITPADVAAYRFGTILNGGNSGPGGNDKAAAPEWLKLADAMWDASTQPLPNGEPVVPLLWATDAVHGHNNIPGATLFPHNVGLGATRDPALVRRIGEATAAEIAVTGIDWTFAPTIAVATDTRWGRAYESYSQDPALVAALGKAMVEGLQGVQGSAAFLDDRHVLATHQAFFRRWRHRRQGPGRYRRSAPCDRGDPRRPVSRVDRGRGAERHGLVQQRQRRQDARQSRAFDRPAARHDEVRWRGGRRLEWPRATARLHQHRLSAGAASLGSISTWCPRTGRRSTPTSSRGARDGSIPMARIDEAATRVIAMKLRAGTFDRPRPSARPTGRQMGHDRIARPSRNCPSCGSPVAGAAQE